MVAAQQGQTSLVSILIKAGANVNRQSTSNGSTALHESAALGHVLSIKSMLDANANAMLINDKGCTALMSASSVYTTLFKYQAINLLLDAKTHVNHQDNQGMTAILILP